MATSLDDLGTINEYRAADEEQPTDLAAFIEADNIADLLEDTEVDEIGSRVCREFEIDKRSRSDWETTNREAMKLAKQIAGKKNYPWPGAANIKYPLLTTASIQFAARAYPAIVTGNQVVKAKVVGEDEDGEKRKRGDRVSRHMSWQLTEQMEEWDEDTDKLLHVLPIAGSAFRKTYFDPIEGRNKSELVIPDDLVVNDGVRNIESATRITHCLEFYPYEMEERMRSGIWRTWDGFGQGEDSEDEDAAHEFLEQHRRLDLDDDGYAEPYIVTVHKDTEYVVRIVANFAAEDVARNEDGEIAKIEAGQCFTHYVFLPDFEGGFYGTGFGYLLRPINEAVNSTINQLLDAGHLANAGGGFIGRGARLRGGNLRFRPGEWKFVDSPGTALAQNLVPLPVAPPSAVLFELLGMLIEAAKDISSVKDVMTGEAQGRNQSPTTTLALIEQGMQVFSAIYKRIFRALKKEYGKLYELNREHVTEDEYFTILDEPEAVAPDDYTEGDFDIVPVADPSVVTNMQKMARAEFMMQFRGDPGVNGKEVLTRVLDAANIEDIDEIILDQQPPDPRTLMEADKIELEKYAQSLQKQELELKAARQVWEIAEIKAKALKALADAEAAEAGPQIEIYKTELADLAERERMLLEDRRDRRAVQDVAQQPGNAAVS